jgi:hypothetical protein
MMLPNRSIMATTREGGSLYQQAAVRPQQGYSSAAAQEVPTGNQSMAGMQDAALVAMQTARTAQHGQIQAAQNFAPGPPEHEVRNAQKAQKMAAQELLMRYKAGMGAAGATDFTHLAALGNMLAQGRG